MPQREPRVVVFTTLFPHPGQPGAGLFIRERMFRVAHVLPLSVVAPQPWFPLQGLLRKWKAGFRPPAPALESQEGIEVRHPRFFSIPGAFKGVDGFFMALGCLPTMLRLKRSFAFNVIDAHFAYPDGYAATLLGRWLRTPVTVTLRGTEVPLSRDPARRRRIGKALERATRIFSVSESLKRHAIALGADGDKIRVVGNGVDVEKFRSIPREDARGRLGLPLDAPVLVSVGALVERKGFHRVIECLPQLRTCFPRLRYLVVGGASPEGDWRAQLERRVDELRLADCVTFLGAMPPAELKVPLSAADVFVLATRNEGWANVFLEAMACGLPVVTTDVGGNAEVVSRADLGRIVAFGDRAALLLALDDALNCSWDRQAIVAHAHANAWDARVATLVDEFRRIAFAAPDAVAARSLEGGRP
jgi:glycosyltransferase involved in cell wall biosynthesis